MNYTSRLLLSLLFTASCRSPQAPTQPAPSSLSFQGPDSGALVRVRDLKDKWVIGRLLEPMSPGATWVILCRDPNSRCQSSSGLAPDSFRVSTLTRLDVRTSAAGKLAGSGLYFGGFVGALIRSPDRTEDTAPMLLGFLAGAGLGGLIGSLFDAWTPVIPCYPHACYRGVPAPLPVRGDST
jgi:hypothetical protein